MIGIGASGASPKVILTAAERKQQRQVVGALYLARPELLIETAQILLSFARHRIMPGTNWGEAPTEKGTA